jgi:quinone-modifying oxidoreductase subunit QmoA
MTDEHTPVTGGILVVGGGISGLTTALEAAEVGSRGGWERCLSG